MLTEKEKYCSSELLSGLSLDDLKELAKTVTNRLNLPVPYSREEIIDLIIRYETDVKSLLRRKKVSKTLLCHYLHYKNVTFNPNDNLSTLINRILALWNKSSQDQQSIELNPVVSEVGQSDEVTLASLGKKSTVVAATLAPGSLGEMAQKFSSWFYDLLNEEFWKRGGDTLGPEHLFSDCTVTVKSMPDQSMEEAVGSEAGSRLLRGTVSQVLLHPASVVAKTELLGVVSIAVTGTIHQLPDSCIGGFQQVFSLVTDPLADGNWKIKHTELRLVSSSQPSIEDVSKPPPFSISMPD